MAAEPTRQTPSRKAFHQICWRCDSRCDPCLSPTSISLSISFYCCRRRLLTLSNFLTTLAISLSFLSPVLLFSDLMHSQEKQTSREADPLRKTNLSLLSLIVQGCLNIPSLCCLYYLATREPSRIVRSTSPPDSQSSPFYQSISQWNIPLTFSMPGPGQIKNVSSELGLILKVNVSSAMNQPRFQENSKMSSSYSISPSSSSSIPSSSNPEGEWA